MKAGDLGRTYEDGEYIIQQGEVGYCMYVIQEGAVEIILEEEGKEIRGFLWRNGALRSRCALCKCPGSWSCAHPDGGQKELASQDSPGSIDGISHPRNHVEPDSRTAQ